MATGATFNPSG
jgi:hypothetical protein